MLFKKTWSDNLCSLLVVSNSFIFHVIINMAWFSFISLLVVFCLSHCFLVVSAFLFSLMLNSFFFFFACTHINLCDFCKLIFLERERAQASKEQRERKSECRAQSRAWFLPKQDSRSQTTRLWRELKSDALTGWATQSPLISVIFKTLSLIYFLGDCSKDCNVYFNLSQSTSV